MQKLPPTRTYVRVSLPFPQQTLMHLAVAHPTAASASLLFCCNGSCKGIGKMSFHWNLSSDEEDETEEWKSKLIVADKSGAARAPNPTLATPTLRQEAAKNDSSVARMPTNNQNVQGFDFSEDDDEEEVDWEDADDDDAEVEEEDSKMPAKETPTPRPVTIDMNQKTAATSPSKTKKKKRGRRSYRFHSLPPHLQSLLIHIQQSHLLALASRAMQISRCCSDVELLHVVHSLVPVVEANSTFLQKPRFEALCPGTRILSITLHNVEETFEPPMKRREHLP
jgi:hypothetical protein